MTVDDYLMVHTHSVRENHTFWSHYMQTEKSAVRFVLNSDHFPKRLLC